MLFTELTNSIKNRISIPVRFDHRLDNGTKLDVFGIVNIIAAEDGSGYSWIITVVTDDGEAKGYLRTAD